VNRAPFQQTAGASGHIVAFLGALFSLLGATGVTSSDISGFVNVVGAIVAMGAVLAAHIAHKSEAASNNQSGEMS
jgi:hypothetical protein